MPGETTELDRKLRVFADTYAQGVAELTNHPVLREGLVKAALNEVIWALYDTFPGYSGDLADHLDLMGDVVRQQATEDDSTRRE